MNKKIVILQKVVGILLLACCVFVVMFVNASALTNADKDCTFLVFVIPVSLYLIFSKRALLRR